MLLLFLFRSFRISPAGPNETGVNRWPGKRSADSRHPHRKSNTIQALHRSDAMRCRSDQVIALKKSCAKRTDTVGLVLVCRDIGTSSKGTEMYGQFNKCSTYVHFYRRCCKKECWYRNVPDADCERILLVKKILVPVRHQCVAKFPFIVLAPAVRAQHNTLPRLPFGRSGCGEGEWRRKRPRFLFIKYMYTYT